MKSTPPTPRGAESRNKGEMLAQRLSYILARLHQGEKIDKHELAQRFSVDVRTIERDLNQRLGDIAHNPKGEGWTLRPHACSTIPASTLNEYADMAGTSKLFPDSSLSYLLQQLKIPARQRALHVQPVPQESLPRHDQRFAQLQAAIEQCHECRFTYKGKPRQAQPYRLIHKHGIWYLAAVESQRLKNFSVALIDSLSVDTASRFAPQQQHLEYIRAKDDVWFTTETTEVLLRVAPEAAHYFARRELLPDQQHRLDGDQSLLVTTRISHPNQLLPVVRYWLPHVRILKPQQWHETLLQELRQALRQWEGDEAGEPASAPSSSATATGQA